MFFNIYGFLLLSPSYETNACPSYLMYRNGMKYELKVAPRFPMDNNGKSRKILDYIEFRI